MCELEAMKKILIVDDHEVLRDGVKRIFDQEPGTATFGEASTVPEAIRLVREEDWDVVVLDISLGDRSGLEVLKELKQIPGMNGVPAIAISGYASEEDRRKALAVGYCALIPKPIDADVLFELIHDLKLPST